MSVGQMLARCLIDRDRVLVIFANERGEQLIEFVTPQLVIRASREMADRLYAAALHPYVTMGGVSVAERPASFDCGDLTL